MKTLKKVAAAIHDKEKKPPVRSKLLCHIIDDQIHFSEDFKNFLKSKGSAEIKVTTVCGVIRGGKSTFLNHLYSLERKKIKYVFAIQNGIDSCTRGAYFVEADKDEILIDVEGDGEPRKDGKLSMGLRRLYMAIFILSTSFLWWNKNFDQQETESLRRTVLDIVDIFPTKALKPKIFFCMKNHDMYTSLPNTIEEVWRRLINEQHAGFQPSQWELIKLPYPLKNIKLEISYEELMFKHDLRDKYLDCLRSLKHKVTDSHLVRSCADLLELCQQLPEVLSDKGFEFDRMYNHKFYKMLSQFEEDLSEKFGPLTSLMPTDANEFQNMVNKLIEEQLQIQLRKAQLAFPEDIVKNCMEEYKLKADQKKTNVLWKNNLQLMEKEGKMKAEEVEREAKKKREEEISIANSLRIIDALWFTQGWWSNSIDEDSKKDVTPILKSRADGKMHFEMTPGEFNTLFGNIAKGWKKFLRVDYSFGDYLSTVTVDSDQPLILAPPPLSASNGSSITPRNK